MSNAKSERERPKGVPHCHGSPMQLIRTVPRLASHPELKTFRCPACGHIETIEAVEAK
jgi:hypothetical protein